MREEPLCAMVVSAYSGEKSAAFGYRSVTRRIWILRFRSLAAYLGQGE